jgi:dienelactone hydrolase
MAQAHPQLTYAAGDVRAWQAKMRRKLKALLRPPVNTHRPLRLRKIWKRSTPLGTIERIVFSAEPGADVPAYWCVPVGARPPYLTYICLQGHSTGMHNSIAVDREDQTTPIQVKGDRDFALGCMQRGIAALCIEQRSLGERRELCQEQISPSSGCHDAVMRSAMLGRTLLGERLFDVDRALDYLEQRGDVDMGRIGIMGHSGGGTTSMYAAALLPRIGSCLASCCFARYADSIMSIYHCSCNEVPEAANYFDMADVFGAIAPRPLVIVNGREDDIFPIDSAKKHFKQVQRIYRAAGAADRCKFVVGPEGHRFYARPAWDAMLTLIHRSR